MLAPQVIDNLGVVGLNLFYLLVGLLFAAVLHMCKHALQGVCCFTHSRHDDKQTIFALHDVCEVTYSIGVTHRGSSKFVYLHKPNSD